MVHFYHKDFERCKIVDMHLSQIVREHDEAKICKIDAEKCPFFVKKLQIKVLPTIICFINGIAVDRIVGFEELGGKDDFPTLLLTRKLVAAGVLKALNKKEKGEITITRELDKMESDSGDDDY